MTAGAHAMKAMRSSGKMLAEVSKLAASMAAVGGLAWWMLGGKVEAWTDERAAQVVAPHITASDPHPVMAKAEDVAEAKTAASVAQKTADKALDAIQRQAEPLGVLVCAQARGKVLRRTCEFRDGRRLPLDKPEALVDEVGAR